MFNKCKNQNKNRKNKGIDRHGAVKFHMRKRGLLVCDAAHHAWRAAHSCDTCAQKSQTETHTEFDTELHTVAKPGEVKHTM